MTAVEIFTSRAMRLWHAIATDRMSRDKRLMCTSLALISAAEGLWDADGTLPADLAAAGARLQAEWMRAPSSAARVH